MNVITRDKDAYHRQTSERMKHHFALPDWSPRQKLALTCRILAAEGHDSGLAGQATIRGDAPALTTCCASAWASTRSEPRTPVGG